MSFNFPIAPIAHRAGDSYFLKSGKRTTSKAFSLLDEISLRLNVHRKVGATAVRVKFLSEDLAVCLMTCELSWRELDLGSDVYESPVDTKKLGVGLYWMLIEVDTSLGVLYGYKNDDCISFSYNKDLYRLPQLTLSSFKYREPTKKYGGIIYHVFVDRFNRGGDVSRKEGVRLPDSWEVMPEYPEYPGAPLKNNCFYGGTLYGIIDKLDYLSSLGVDTIYLSPIFEAISNHKYDTADYMKVDSMFGGEEALVSLIREAKLRNIGIILDGVFNHTGSDSVYFNKYSNYDSLGAYQSKESEYYPWYHFDKHPDKYTCWWGIEILPRINPDKPSCSSYFVGDGGVVDKYSSMGIDGFRLDVVDELSDSFVKKIKACLNKNNKSSVLYGEVWEDASNKIAYGNRKSYYLGEELDGVMNYPLRKGIIDFLLNSDCSSLLYALTDINNNAPERIRHLQMNVLGTHDTERILTVLSGESSDGCSNAVLATKRLNDEKRVLALSRLKLAYTILATVPGIPAIFYGDEVGLEGYHDPFNRMPYPWGRENKELLSFYSRIGAIRRSNSVYKKGEFDLLELDQRLLLFARYSPSFTYLTLINNSPDNLCISFSNCATEMISATRIKSGAEYTLPGFTPAVLKLRRDSETVYYFDE